jgi:hypothetical protein
MLDFKKLFDESFNFFIFLSILPPPNIFLIKNNIKNPSNAYGVVNVSIKDTKGTSINFIKIVFH